MDLLDYADRYIHRHLGLAVSSAEQLRVAVRRLNAWAQRSVSCTELREDLITPFLRAQLVGGYTPSTVNNRRRILLTLWRAATDEGLAPALQLVSSVPEPQRLPEAWTLEQVGILFAHIRTLPDQVDGLPASDWWGALLLAAYDTGERIGALRAVYSVDFHPDEHCLVVRAEHQKCHRDRLLTLSPEAVEAILRIRRPGRRQLFPWPWCDRHFFRTLRRIVEDAGLPTSKRGMGLSHRLRRTSGSLVEAAGGDGARHLGNSRAVFERHYRDPRICGGGQLRFLPRPKVPSS